MKQCPYCAEEIRDEAVKCRHCGSILDETLDGTPTAGSRSASLPAGLSGDPYDLDAAPTMEGQRILAGRYRIVRELGHGGMGAVYLAHDDVLDIDVALKLLPALLARDRKAMDALKREAKTAMRLAHHNIVRVHTLEETDEATFLVMEYVEGQTLADLLHEKGPLTVADLLPIAEQVAAGLDYAHSQNVLHRDIKPSNILLAADGTAKLADFGIAREMKESQTRLTGRQTSGTLLYMSPEQVMGDELDARSDIYSFGAVLYECLSGRPPFTHGDISKQICEKRPADLAGVQDHVNGAIQRALAKDRHRRLKPASMLVVQLAALRAIAPAGYAAHQPRGSSHVPEDAAVAVAPLPVAKVRPARRNALIVLLGLILLGAVATVTVLVWHLARRPRPVVAVTPASQSAPIAANGRSSDVSVPGVAPDASGWHEVAGTFQPRKTTILVSPTAGRVVEVAVKKGDQTSKGDVLVRFYVSDHISALESAQAQSAAAAAAVQRATVAKGAAQASVSLATTEHERVKALYEKRIASQSEFEDSEANSAQARIALEQADADLALARAEAQLATLAVAEAEVAGARAEVLAPGPGVFVVAEVLVEPGEAVSRGQRLLVLVDPASLWLVADVQDTLIHLLHRGQTATVIAAGDTSIEGTVDEIVPTIDPVERTVSVKVLVPWSKGLYLGAAGRLRIRLPESETPPTQVDSAVGVFRSRTRMALTAQTTGTVTGVSVKAGDRLTADGKYPLIVLDDRDFQAQVKWAQANAEMALAKEQRAAADVRAAENNMARAKKRLERARELVAKMIATPDEEEQAKSEYSQAEAAVTQAKQGVAIAEEAIAAAGREADLATAALALTRIYAPPNVTGVVAERHAEPGDWVVPGRPLLVVHDPGNLRLEVDVPEAFIGRISAGQVLTIAIPVLERSIQGTVEHIAPALSPASRTLSVKVAVPTAAGLSPGMIGVLRLPRPERPAGG